MLNEKELPFLAEKGHIVSLVGGGGKTTLLYAMAAHCARKGWRVLVMTTTHIRQPAACYAPDDAALTALWQAGHYAVIGTPAENGKLTLPPQQLLRRMAQADAVFIEADGAKHHPCKLPAAHDRIRSYRPCSCTFFLFKMRQHARYALLTQKLLYLYALLA